ncbi:MAG: hypothetical protein JSV10_03005 [Candidatus Zixiibacteriota bacterium]|nr:MAG: hypothetical protein JSV10_03005 [candidate division Zixibacteria bacterium]
MRKTSLIIVIACIFFGCGPFQKALRVEPKGNASQPEAAAEQSTDRDETDVGRVAREMMADCLSGAWIPAYVGVTGDKPVVTVGPIHDWTDEGIDARTFTAGCEQELSESDQVSFAASQRRPEEAGEESSDQQEFVSRETIRQIKVEAGANFVLVGAIRSMADTTAGSGSPYYQVELEMINTKTMARVWRGSERINK